MNHNASERIRLLLEACFREDFGPNVLGEWEELRSIASPDGSALQAADLGRLHLAGYYIFDRSGRPAQALQELEASISYEDTRSPAANLSYTGQLLTYAAHCAGDEAKTLKYLDKILKMRLRSRKRRRLRIIRISTLIEPECKMRLPEPWMSRIEEVIKEGE